MSKASRAIRADGEVTRARIVEAAGELVAARGFAQTPSKEVALRAEVDLASINYHFGGRDGLYQVVLAEAHRRLIALPDLGRVAQAEAPAEEKLRSLIEFLVTRTLQSQSWHARVLAREILSPSPQLRSLLEEEIAPKFVIVRRLLGEITGLPEDHPALLRCILNIGAPCAVLLVSGSELPGPFKPVLNSSRAELVEHLHTFALAGLKAIGRQHAEREAVRSSTRRKAKDSM